MGANVEGGLAAAHILHTFALSKDNNRLLTNKKEQKYEKDDDRPRGNVCDDNEC
jgi:hypothetical protein